MKTIINYIILFTLSLMLFNCSQYDDNPSEQIERINYRVSNFYTGIGTFDITYNQNHYIETIEVPNGSTYSLTYNTNNKITAIGDETYLYNESNNVTSVTSENSDASIEYNSQGKISLINSTKINVDNSESYSIASFTYNAQGLIDYITENNSNEPTLTFRNSFTYDSNLNIVKMLEEESSDGINYTITRTLTTSYDNKNPPYFETNNILNDYSKTSVYNLWNFYSYELTRKSFQSLWYYSPNNYITIHKVKNTGETTVFNFENTYNNQDYVTSMDRTITSPTGTETYAVYGFNYEIF